MVVRALPRKPTVVVRALGKRGIRAFTDGETVAELSLKQLKNGLTAAEEVRLFCAAGRILRARSKR
jgi:hypothetical protein